VPPKNEKGEKKKKNKEPKEPKEPKEHRGPKEHKEHKEHKDHKEHKEPKAPKTPKEHESPQRSWQSNLFLNSPLSLPALPSLPLMKHLQQQQKMKEKLQQPKQSPQFEQQFEQGSASTKVPPTFDVQILSDDDSQHSGPEDSGVQMSSKSLDGEAVVDELTMLQRQTPLPTFPKTQGSFPDDLLGDFFALTEFLSAFGEDLSVNPKDLVAEQLADLISGPTFVPLLLNLTKAFVTELLE